MGGLERKRLDVSDVLENRRSARIWKNCNSALNEVLELNLEAKYKSQISKLKSEFGVPNNLSGKLVRISLKDKWLAKDNFNLSPRICFSDNWIYAAVGSTIYMIRNLWNHWENVTLPISERNDRTWWYWVEMFVSEVCNNVDKCKVEIERKKDDPRLG